MIDLRCKRCRKLLLRAEDIRSGKAELKCPNCKTKNTYCFSAHEERSLGWFDREEPKAVTPS